MFLFFSTALKVLSCYKLQTELCFLHECEDYGLLFNFPKADTCSCILYLPTTHLNYESFKTSFSAFKIQGVLVLLKLCSFCDML